MALAAAFLSPLVVISCGDDEGGSDSPSVKIEVKTVAFDCPAEASSFTIQVEANVEPTVSTTADWLHVAKPEIADNLYKYAVTSDANTATQVRNATVDVTYAPTNFKASVSVKQAAAEKSDNPVDPVDPVEPADPIDIIAAMGMGWNLGNNLDAHVNGTSNETSWGNKACTQETMNAVRNAGFRTVRIPVTWLGHVSGSSDNYKIDDVWLDRVAEVVSYAEKAGLYAIINIHHDGADSKYWLDIKNAATTSDTNGKVKDQLTSMWTQIANKFADKGDFLIFETLNEIHDGEWGWGANRSDNGAQYATLNEWNQVAVDAIRATDGNNATRYIGVPGYVCNPDLTLEQLVIPNDPAGRILVAVHDYDPNEYTLEAKYNAWGHLATSSDNAPKENESQITNTFKKLKEKYVDAGIGVYIGEIGCVHRSSTRAEAFRKYYLEYVCKAAKTYGLAPIYWDNGSAGAGKECSGLLNHGTGEYLNNGKEIVDVMVNAIESTDPDYTLESVYNNTKID